MNISVQCVHCQKRYNAPASLAGKRIKCKHCGQVFAIPVEADAAIPSPTLEPEAPAAPIRSGEEKRKNPLEAALRAAGGTGEEPVQLGDPRFGIASKRQRVEGTDEVALAEETTAPISLRPSVPFDFPGAAVLDRALPTFLIVLGLGWLCAVAGQTNTTGQTWVTFVRPAVYLMLFLGLAVPIGWVAVSKAALRCRFAYPPSPVLRTLAALALGFALPLIFWMSSDGGMGMFVFGAVLGLGTIAGALWFLFRLQPQELQATLTGSAAGYVASMALTYGILLGVHTIFEKTASPESNQLAASPMGPFAWHVPVKSAEVRQVARATTGETVSASQPENGVDPVTQPTTKAATEPTTDVTTRSVVITTSPVPTQPLIAPATTRTVAVVPDPATREVKPPVTTTRTVVVETQPAPQSTSPLVAALTRVRETARMTEMLAAATPSAFIGVVRSKEPEDTIEVWSANPPAKKWEATFRREKEVHGQRYVLSPNGELAARVITWPKLAVQVWSFKEGKDVRSIALKAEMTGAGLIAFTSNDGLLLHYGLGGKTAMEVYNIKPVTPVRTAAFATDALQAASGNPSISPDGRVMALAAFSNADNKGGIDFYDLTQSRSAPMRTYFPPLPKWIMPTGLCFSPDGKSVAAMFEQDGRGFLAHIRVADAKAIREHIYTSLPVEERAIKGYGGRVIEFVADGSGWLYYGRALLEAETGKVLGQLEVDGARSQRVVDRETVWVQSVVDFENALTEVKLKSEALAAKVGEVRRK